MNEEHDRGGIGIWVRDAWGFVNGRCRNFIHNLARVKLTDPQADDGEEGETFHWRLMESLVRFRNASPEYNLA